MNMRPLGAEQQPPNTDNAGGKAEYTQESKKKSKEANQQLGETCRVLGAWRGFEGAGIALHSKENARSEEHK